ncbi:MAG: hypothetical protein AABY40_03975 [Nanoarchaeota archaeon]
MESKASEYQKNKQGSLVSIILLVFIVLTLGAAIYLLLQPGAEEGSSMRTALFSIIAVTATALIVYIAWEFSAANRLRRMLKKITPKVDSEPMDEVKEIYLKIYNLYLKLSEKKKNNFYARVNTIRENIEENMQKEKELERLLNDTDKGSIEEQKERYLKLYAAYEKLPQKMQNQYYPKIVQLRDRLERGK